MPAGIRFVHLGKYIKNIIDLIRRNAYARIGNRQLVFPAFRRLVAALQTNCYHTRVGEFDRIANQVIEYLRQLRPVTNNAPRTSRITFSNNFEAFFACQRLIKLYRLFNQLY